MYENTEIEQSICALERALEPCSEGAPVERGIVSVHHKDTNNFASGLLLTTDGWIVIPYHLFINMFDCFHAVECSGSNDWPDTEPEWFVSTGDNGYCVDPLSGWYADPAHDVAIVRGYIIQTPRVIRYGVGDGVSVGEFVRTMRIGNAGPYDYPGVVDEVFAEPIQLQGGDWLFDAFRASAHSEPGFSGSPVVDLSSRLRGMLVAGNASTSLYTNVKYMRAAAMACAQKLRQRYGLQREPLPVEVAEMPERRYLMPVLNI
ncbi:MAG: serine protease [Candidatus Woesearchaeota archaeon]